MCGICGVVQVSGVPRAVIERHRLDAMTDAMTHRGPDDRGTFAAPGVALGVRRLSIVDVEGGHQPVSRTRTGRSAAIQNGELYNHAAIRDAARREGHRFSSRCDTEILPHLYEDDGAGLRRSGCAGCSGSRSGTRATRRAVLARDRLGVKPLY